MDRLRAIETFVRIVERGSLTAAAEAMGVSLPGVVRTLAALEAMLDVRLLNRTTRRMALTDEGREYYERCKRILAQVEEAAAALSARRVAPKGRLRLTAPVVFGRLHVAPVAREFVVRHSGVVVDLVLLDRVVDLLEEGIDVGVRIGELPDSSLVAINVGQTRRVVCASPGYLRRHGVPRTAEDLASHRCVNFAGLAPASEWTLATGRAVERVAVAPILASNQIDPVLDACERGLGLGQFLCYQVRAPLDAGRLRRVLREFEPAPLPIHVIYPGARLLSATVRAFVDWSLPRLRARLAATDAARATGRSG
ncbi:MAG: LysR substrate-binding domain-containing protein [Rudaea sp.]